MTLTLAGRAKIAAALADGTFVTLAQMALGDGAGLIVAPDEQQVALVREVWRGTLNSVAVDPSAPGQIIAEAIVPSDVGGWVVREVGLFDADGLLVAIGSFAENYKPVATEGATREMIVQVYLAVASTAAISVQVNSTIAVATRNYVDQRTTRAFILPGGNAGNVLAKQSNADGDTRWIDMGDGVSISVDAREERQSLAAGQTIVDLAVTITVGAAVYVSGLRLLRDIEWFPTTATRITLAAPAPAGASIVVVNNESASPLSFLQKDKNLSDLSDAAAARETLGLLAFVIDLVYPVGSLYLSANSTSPAVLFGHGTWVRHAEGRTLIGQQSSDTSFATSGQTGGLKSITLSASQLPSHSARIAERTVSTGVDGSHFHGFPSGMVETSEAGEHTHEFQWGTGLHGASINVIGVTSGNRARLSGYSADVAISLMAAGKHKHTISLSGIITARAGDHSHIFSIPQHMSDFINASVQPVPILPPYVVTYIWRRTA